MQKAGLKALVIFTLIVVSSSMLLNQSIPKAYASGPSFEPGFPTTKFCNIGGSPVTCATTTAGTVNSGDKLIGVGEFYDGHAVACATVSTISDTLANTFTLEKTSGCNTDSGGGEQTYVWFATAATTGIDDFTINCCTAGQATSMAVQFYAVTGGLSTSTINTGAAIGTWAGASGGTIQLASALSFDSTNALIIMGFGDSSFGPKTPGSGYTGIGLTSSYEVAGQYALCSGSCNFPTNPSTVPIITSTSSATFGWAEVAVAFTDTAPPPSPVTQILIVPCGFFQLQCWWYPMIFMGSIAGFFIAAGFAAEASSRSMTYLTLAAFTYGSLLSVIAGMMVYFVPIILIITTIFYAVRFR